MAPFSTTSLVKAVKPIVAFLQFSIVSMDHCEVLTAKTVELMFAFPPPPGVPGSPCGPWISFFLQAVNSRHKEKSRIPASLIRQIGLLIIIFFYGIEIKDR